MPRRLLHLFALERFVVDHVVRLEQHDLVADKGGEHLEAVLADAAGGGIGVVRIDRSTGHLQVGLRGVLGCDLLEDQGQAHTRDQTDNQYGQEQPQISHNDPNGIERGEPRNASGHGGHGRDGSQR